VNPGGEPERDDTGLPPVDIEIPDDARELDRDVQAYYREQRAQRRRQRRLRLHGSLARDGIVLPLLACCLILALITGTLLTVFTAASDQNLPGPSGKAKLPGAASAAPSAARSASASAPAAGAAAGAGIVHAGPLPPGELTVNGGQVIPLDALGPAMLVLVPAHCNCMTAISWLVNLAASRGDQAYLVGSTAATLTEAKQFDGQLTGPARAATSVALEAKSLLQRSYPAKGLTAVLVAADGSVAYADNLGAAGNQEVPSVTAELIKALMP
jgi:hypothetical protein